MKKELKDKYVYLHRDVNNTIFYVGVGGKSRHKFTQNRSNLWKDVAKGGYTIEKHKEGITLSEAFKIEIDLIELIGRKDLGLGALVNKTSGGAGAPGTVTSDLTRSRMSKAQKGRVITKECRDKLRKANLGKKQSQETKDKKSKALRGLKKPKGFGAKIALANSKRVFTKEIRENMSRAQRGRKQTKEHTANSVLAKRRRLISDKDWESLLEDFSKIDKIINGVTYKNLSIKYNVTSNYVCTNFLRYKKNK